MLASSVAAGVLNFLRRGPDVLKRATFFLRGSNYFDIGRQNSMDDKTDQIHWAKGVRVCVGDIRPAAETGYVAIGNVGEAIPLSWQDRARRYEHVLVGRRM
ncbi:hypothetical protein CORC01_04608 [Colletotrichum orchidophilum]|uniref:Uncharacterized protein n=1 Tax=Colletotrichum orchidophilum TaxID=1209926 RepID=A0A1G4BFC6_9PEZI|nr:uncharacterized protein CORC01_04608 [Colletotrichum orchidophilum]OHF00200.1 hypothetical protein CORC01_04608 [Colletotrichum orchidophilum]